MAGAAKREVAESSFDFLHYSIVNTVSRCAWIRLRGRATDTSCINIESVFELNCVHCDAGLVVAIAGVESRQRKREHVCLFPHLYIQFKCMYVRIVHCESVKACVHAFLYTRFHTFTLNWHFPACSSLTHTYSMPLSLLLPPDFHSRSRLFPSLARRESARSFSCTHAYTITLTDKKHFNH